MELRGLENRVYDRERKALGHPGLPPVILEACQETELSYEYRDGAASFGAFTFRSQRSCASRASGRNLSFDALTRVAAARLEALRYEQTPALVGPPRIVKQAILGAREAAWSGPRSSGTC